MKILKKKYIKPAIQIVILGLAIWVLGPQLRELTNNRQVIRSLSISWLLLGATIFFASYIFSALVYQFLSPKRLLLTKNIVVQLSTAFTNRLLPSGVGGISTNSLFLIRSGYKKPAAVSLALTNNLVGFLAFCLVIIISGAVSPEFLTNTFEDLVSFYPWLAVAAMAVTVYVFFSPNAKKRLRKNVAQSIDLLKGIVGSPFRFSLALLSSCLITICYAGALYCCLKAAGINLPVNELMLVFAASAIAVTVSPTPNGLGASEVSMLTALEKSSVASSPALAAIIAFRLISFWIPILPGYVLFRISVAKRLV